MALATMQHNNCNVMAAVDIETTGFDCDLHEIVQIAVLILDHNFLPNKTVLPFYINMIPEHPEYYENDAQAVSKIKLADLVKSGFDQIRGSDLFIEWFEKLDMPYTKYGTRGKLVPLGQNYQFDRGFIAKWLGPKTYEFIFHHGYRDTMISAHFVNDRQAFAGQSVLYPKVDLSYLASCLEYKRQRAHDALQDCITTAEVYRRMLMKNNLFG